MADASPSRPAFRALDLGAVKPRGWLLDQLRAQADGLSGNLTKFWDHDSWWCGGEGENMLGDLPARGHVTPDLVNGLVPLAWLLEDPALQAQAQEFVEYAISSSREDGRFGPPQVEEPPYCEVLDLGRSKLMQALTAYAEATGDERVVPVLESYFRGYLTAFDSHGRSCWINNTLHQENLVAGMWLYRRTGDQALRSLLISMCHRPEPESRWAERFGEGGVAVPHGYAVAHALKYPAYRYELEGRRDDVEAISTALAMLDEQYGQVGGRFAAHEFLPIGDGRRPTNGTELCDVVEHMFSLEKLFEIVGDPRFGDRLEALAFNALPATCTGDFWAHQYDQQTNQVLVTKAQREFDNGPESNLFGLMPSYICCTANMHQGWPRFVQHMWMGTDDGGVVAFAYGPSEVSFTTADDVLVVLREETEYPFDGRIGLTVESSRAARFPLSLRIPGWAKDVGGRRAVVRYKDRRVEAEPGTIHRIDETWEPGETITLDLPMRFAVPEPRSATTVAFRRGPLYFALRIDAEYRELEHYYKGSRDWEIVPRSPWNITPLVHPLHAAVPAETVRAPLTRLPFAARGEPIYDPDTDSHAPWPHDEPVVLKLKGRRTANWGMHPVWSSADDAPEAPEVEPEDVDIELVPYGSTRLRVAEFPRADRVRSAGTVQP